MLYHKSFKEPAANLTKQLLLLNELKTSRQYILGIAQSCATLAEVLALCTLSRGDVMHAEP